ncbi:proline-rich proteoglycan 2-like [Mustela erminea]|uniref:proline-rich proteoglycan 2-like n=1 Tax=Mustela erminea TaxID=36723 RepID=UPI001387443F|nr:proline-rich proteoglycan 2-like [Mustela erminea]
MTNTNDSKGALRHPESAKDPLGPSLGGDSPVQPGRVPPPRTPRAAAASPPRRRRRRAKSPGSLPWGRPPPAGPRATSLVRPPRRSPAHCCRFPPAVPGRPGPLVPEPARAATCRGRRASQRPAAAILHFKPAALFRESTLTCEPYTRNRSAGRHTASAARRGPRSVEGRGWGCEARRAPQRPTGGGEGGKEPAEAGPSRARAVRAPPPRSAPGSPLPDPAAPLGFDPGLYPLDWPATRRLQSSNQVKNMSIKTSVNVRGEKRS